jgi:hypothetical protein
MSHFAITWDISSSKVLFHFVRFIDISIRAFVPAWACAHEIVAQN